MARRQRGVRKLETFEHKVSQMSIPIYLNTNTSTFEAEVEQDGWHCSKKDLNELKQELGDYLDNRTDLGWRWIIEIDHASLSRFHGEAKKHIFGFSMKKYMLSKQRVNGKYLQTEQRDLRPSHPDLEDLDKYYIQDRRVWRW